jgi:hypothetical protein
MDSIGNLTVAGRARPAPRAAQLATLHSRCALATEAHVAIPLTFGDGGQQLRGQRLQGAGGQVVKGGLVWLS